MDLSTTLYDSFFYSTKKFLWSDPKSRSKAMPQAELAALVLITFQ